MEKEPKTKYIEAVGRRKTSIARARAVPSAKNSISINDGKSINDYFITETQRIIAMESLNKSPMTLSITAKIKGGGISSQAEALRHA
ncbi:MAG: 30S ribosomal protein S9, partial [Candidatus Taylorbacteria bacterium]|nr:30S ribosomal protein S9 [Candidatus Taylorbacteria bacterium]